MWLATFLSYRGGSRKKYFAGPGPSSFGRQQWLSEITIEPINSTSSLKKIGGAGQDLGGLCPHGPNIEPPLLSYLYTDAPLYLRQFTRPLTSRLDKDFGPLPPIGCLFLPSDFLLLDVAPFLSLVHVYGTIYLWTIVTLPPHSLCLHLSNDYKCTYFVCPIPVSTFGCADCKLFFSFCGPWSSCSLLRPR